MERCFRVVMFVAILAAAAVPWHSSTVHACSCAYPRDPTDLRLVDTVFAGTVVSIGQYDPKFSSGQLIPVLLAVDHIWHGDTPPLTTVRTAAAEASCGYSFRVDARYVVYARGGETGYCSQTRPADRATVQAIESVTGPGRAVERPDLEATNGHADTSPPNGDAAAVGNLQGAGVGGESGGWNDRALVAVVAGAFVAFAAALGTVFRRSRR